MYVVTCHPLGGYHPALMTARIARAIMAVSNLIVQIASIHVDHYSPRVKSRVILLTKDSPHRFIRSESADMRKTVVPMFIE